MRGLGVPFLDHPSQCLLGPVVALLMYYFLSNWLHQVPCLLDFLQGLVTVPIGISALKMSQ